jgi:isoquinoline 1-oxidoreductase alpha subunit
MSRLAWQHLEKNPMPQIKINGVEHTIDADPQMPLLWAIRDIVGLTGTKFGCGVGACGACTVHLDGQAVRSCLMTLADAHEHEIVTIEGLSADGTHPVQLAWEANNVPQCGYCQARQIMQAAALIKQTPRPTDRQIADAMSGNICRCGTYQRIRQAIKSVAVGECQAQSGFVAHGAQRPQARLWRPRESRGDDAGAAVQPGAAQGPEGLALYRQSRAP